MSSDIFDAAYGSRPIVSSEQVARQRLLALGKAILRDGKWLKNDLIVGALKKAGVFDDFRRIVLADIDQELRQGLTEEIIMECPNRLDKKKKQEKSG